jgi:hypothetical protein
LTAGDALAGIGLFRIIISAIKQKPEPPYLHLEIRDARLPIEIVQIPVPRGNRNMFMHMKVRGRKNEKLSSRKGSLGPAQSVSGRIKGLTQSLFGFIGCFAESICRGVQSLVPLTGQVILLGGLRFGTHVGGRGGRAGLCVLGLIVNRL